MNGVTPASLINIASGFVTVLTLLTLLWTALRYSYNPYALTLQAEIGKATAMGLLEMAKQAKREGRVEDERLLMRKAVSLLEACGAWVERKGVLQRLGARYVERAEEARRAGNLEEAAKLFKFAEFTFAEAYDQDGQITAVKARVPIETVLELNEPIKLSKDDLAQIELFAQGIGKEFDIEAVKRDILAEMAWQRANESESSERFRIDYETSQIRKQKRLSRWFLPVMLMVGILYVLETVWYYFILTPSHR